MESLNTSGLKRNPDAIKKCFKTIGGSIIATKDIRLIFPERYINKNIATVGSTVRVVSIYAILDNEGNYAVSNVPVMVELTPSNIGEIEASGINKVCYFEKDSVFAPKNTLIKDDKFLYDLFDEFIINGNVPAFMNYEDISNIIAQARKYAGQGIGDNPVAMEILASIISKSKENDEHYMRQFIKNKGNNTKIKYIGLKNLYHTFDNTISKLVGNYYSTGVTTAILDKEEKTTNIEEILRA